MRVPSRWLILLWVALLSGCAMMALGLEKPEVSVTELQILPGGSLLEQRLRLTLRVANPNNREIAIDGLSFRFEVDGHDLARGLSNQAVVLPKLGETTMSVDVSGSIVDLLRHAPKMLEGGRPLGYRVYGDVVTRDYGRLPFDRKGEVSLDKLGGGVPGAVRGQI
ncbi:hypothetical protein GCM10025771_14020 [Niveibacterium umoris]|uniref:LEA14-like dessication related protein n=1 Tax=Niveibacterium umoris TaxID=1193620 RepID=A0A840BV89_9RHOO|nr:LEA type 2 family protein [Niveibacterium umoris]MBB4014726.1 LEA14-like dessication related protein [Niveibacterium umoris]